MFHIGYIINTQGDTYVGCATVTIQRAACTPKKAAIQASRRERGDCFASYPADLLC